MSELFVTRIAISEKVISPLVDLLNIQLANTIQAQQMIKFAHWNVKGNSFLPTHELFDRIFKNVMKGTDRIGERITALGGVAEGLPDQVTDSCTLTPYEVSAKGTTLEHIEGIANVVGELGNGLRHLAGSATVNGIVSVAEETAVRDLVTQNMLLDMTEDLDKLLYFLEAHLRS